MLEFKKLTLDDIENIRPYFLYSETRASDNTVGAVIMWRDYFSTEYAFDGGTLAVKFQQSNGPAAFLMPLGKDVLGTLEKIAAYCHENNIPTVIRVATNKDIELLGSLYNISISPDIICNDYLYNASDLRSMAGRRYSGQRNHINQFKREYPDYYTKPLEAGVNVRQVREFFDRYNASKVNTGLIFSTERDKVYEVLDNYTEYGQTGLVLYAGGEIKAFSIGETIKDTLFTHIEKADTGCRGAYQMIVREYANYCVSANPGIVYINREDDAGDEGLRKSKLSYHPCNIIEKFTVTLESQL